MKNSTISSCYDDSDNQMRFGVDRGNLPVVIVNSWKEVNSSRLENEWARIIAVDPQTWDWKRLLMTHWIDRIGCNNSYLVA